MAKDFNAKKIVAACNDAERAAKKARIKAQCGCCHQKNNRMTLVKTGDKSYMCTECGKQNIQFTEQASNIEEVKKLVKNVSNLCDIIKVNLQPENEEDADILKKIGKTQFVMEYMAVPLIESIKRHDKKKKKKDKNQESAWGKSRLV